MKKKDQQTFLPENQILCKKKSGEGRGEKNQIVILELKNKQIKLVGLTTDKVQQKRELMN